MFKVEKTAVRKRIHIFAKLMSIINLQSCSGGEALVDQRGQWKRRKEGGWVHSHIVWDALGAVTYKKLAEATPVRKKIQ